MALLFILKVIFGIWLAKMLVDVPGNLLAKNPNFKKSMERKYDKEAGE